MKHSITKVSTSFSRVFWGKLNHFLLLLKRCLQMFNIMLVGSNSMLFCEFQLIVMTLPKLSLASDVVDNSRN